MSSRFQAAVLDASNSNESAPTGIQVANQWGPLDYGFLAWAYDPALASSTSTPLPTAGTLNVTTLKWPVSQVITYLDLYLLTNGATLTAGQCFAALFQNGSFLGVTADQASAWGAGAPKLISAPIASGPVFVPAGDIQVVPWFNGTTGPAFLRAAGGAFINMNLPASGSRWATANSGVTGTAPGTLSALTAASTSYWAAVH